MKSGLKKETKGEVAMNSENQVNLINDKTEKEIKNTNDSCIICC